MTDDEAKQIVKAAANVLLESVADIIDEDPHMWGTRPCSTCKFVSTIVGRPFGCTRKALRVIKHSGEQS